MPNVRRRLSRAHQSVRRRRSDRVRRRHCSRILAESTADAVATAVVTAAIFGSSRPHVVHFARGRMYTGSSPSHTAPRADMTMRALVPIHPRMLVRIPSVLPATPPSRALATVSGSAALPLALNMKPPNRM